MSDQHTATSGSRPVHLLGGVALVALAAGLASAPAHAQTTAAAPAASPAAPASSEIVVTGSRIRGVAPVGSGLINMTRQDIVTAGPATTAAILRELPQIQGLGAGPTATSAQNGAANVTRASGVNLRGIGTTATLMLFDGQRFPVAGTQGQVTDPSVIPAIALQRVEVVADGASAIYGSDAVAGVVNLITRKDFTGLETTARYGAANGYNEYQISGIGGKKWDGGGVVLAYEHDYNSHLQGSSRSWYTTYLTPQGGKDYRANLCAPGNITISGVTYAIPASGVTPATASQLVPGTTNLCDNIKQQDIIPQMTRDSVYLNAHQDLTGSISVFADGFFSRRTDKALAVRTGSLTVPSSNAFFTRPVGSLATSETVTYNFGSVLGGYEQPLSSLSGEIVGGVNFKLPHAWRGQASLSYGRSDDFADRQHEINTGAVNTYLASSDPTVALNVYGGANNPATLAAISNGYFRIKARTALETAAFQADGPLATLPGGDLRLAVGGEYRYEGLTGNLINGSAVAPFSVWDTTHRTIEAAYGELFVPIVGAQNAVPFIESLDLSVAGRIERYSDVGSTSNPKIGLNWKPINDFKIRASYGTSFRAPTLAQADPHSSGWGLYSDTLPNALGQNVYGIGVAGGNPSLKPETAKTYSVGGDWTPAMVPGLRASLTYFKVDYLNQVVNLRGTPGLTSLPIYASYVIWNPSPALVQQYLAKYPQNAVINAPAVTFIADGRAQNVGQTYFQGLDFDVHYSWAWPVGDFKAGVTGTYFLSLTAAVAPGAALFSAADRINYPQRLRDRWDVSWSQGPWRAVGYINYADAYTNNTVTPVQKVSAYTTADLNVAYTMDAKISPWLNNVTVALEVQNLMDARPPFVNISSGYDPQSASPIGRLVAVSIDKTW